MSQAFKRSQRKGFFTFFCANIIKVSRETSPGQRGSVEQAVEWSIFPWKNFPRGVIQSHFSVLTVAKLDFAGTNEP